MIEKMNIPPEEAVKRFQQARGHNIERKPYVDDLKNGCKGGSESNVPLKIMSYHLEIKEKKYRPKRQSHNRNFNMKEKRFRSNDMAYNCLKLNGELKRTHIEDTADLCSNDRNNEPAHFKNKDTFRRGHSEKDKQQSQNSQSVYQRPHVHDQPLFDGRFNYDSPTSLYSKTGNPCYSQPNSSYLGSRNRQPGRFKSEQMDYCDNSKPQADINASIPLSSCQELKKLNSSDFSWWREPSNRPGHNTYPVSQFHPQRPPQNSSSSIRPSNSQARFQRPPPCSNRPPFPQHPYQAQNRVWIRPSQPNRKPIPRHNTLSTPSTTNLNYEHSKFSLPCERNIQAQSPFQTCKTQTNINQKVQIDVKSDSRVS